VEIQRGYSQLTLEVSNTFDNLSPTIRGLHDEQHNRICGAQCDYTARAIPVRTPRTWNEQCGARDSVLRRRRRIAGSLIGGIRETHEMLDFCAAHGITSDVEVIPMQDINIAYERILKSDVKYRFVIDIASLR
jgi:hypothetical protein